MKTKLTVVALLAFAAGGTCPSDVNNDGTVGIQDFLMVLGAWGPCPNATVISMEAQVAVTHWFIRSWSDGRVEVIWEDFFDTSGVWFVSEAPPSSNAGQPVDISVTFSSATDCSLGRSPTCAEQGFATNGSLHRLYRQYADGSAEYIFLAVCADAELDDFCVGWDTAWTPVQEVTIK